MEDTPQNTESSAAGEAEQPSRIDRLAKLAHDNGIGPQEFALMVLEYAGALMIGAHDRRGDNEPSWMAFEDDKGPFRVMASRPDPSSVVLQDAEGNEIKPN